MPRPVAVIPLRDLAGMTRLSGVLGEAERSSLVNRLATRAVAAAQGCGLRVVVVSSDDAVTRWAHDLDVEVCPDPGRGLSAAATAGISYADGGPWLVIHADLPLITPTSLQRVADAAMASTVLVPSQDGGTTVIAGRGSFPFSYGAGSFQRHFAGATDASVVVSPALTIDIDTPRDLSQLTADG